MSHEFKLHHYMSQLMGSLGIDDISDCPGAEVLTRILEKNAGSNVITQASASSAKKKMTQMAEDSQEFLEKYDELKSKNVKDVDALVSLMVKIKKDPQVQCLLVHSNFPVHPPSDLLAQGDINIAAHIKDELSRVASTQATIVASEAVKRATSKDRKRHKQTKTLTMPNWLTQRPCLTMDFSTQHMADPHDMNLGGMGLQEQEECLVTDLLYCLEGISGRFIRVEPLEHKQARRKFTIDAALDGSLRELACKVLPLSCSYSAVVRFNRDQFDFINGLVNQALAATFRTIITDYMILITQLEQQHKKGKLSLQKLWFYIQTPVHTFSILHSFILSINKGNLRGGAVLTLLHEKIPSYLGDPRAQKLCFHLTKSASLPYFRILEKWIYKGILVDHYNEFLIEEDAAFKKEKLGEDFNYAYWEQRYTVQWHNTPCFLSDVAIKVLNTGKYLNVIRQCGRDVTSPSVEAIEYSADCRQFVQRIEDNFQWSSSLLLGLLMKEMDLMTRLRSLKHYFMLDQGDFIMQFMDLAENELKKPMDDILLPRLDTLLELALRTSTANVDPYKDDLKVDLLPYDLISQLFKILSIETKQEKEYHRLDATDLHLSGLESFSFDYVVRWPVSLVLNRKALTRYQMLSRHLFYSKHVERQLCNVWVMDKGLKQSCSAAVRAIRSNAYALRQRMISFVQNLEYYSMFEVIEPLWLQFEIDIANVRNVDEVLVLHNDLLNNCMKHCMLTNPRLLKILHKLMMICVTFCNFMQKISAHLNDIDDDTEAGANKSSNRLTIATFDDNFSKHLIDLLNKIVAFSVGNREQRLITFVHRLDYNGFYKNEMDKLAAARMTSHLSESSSRHGGSTSSV